MRIVFVVLVLSLFEGPCLVASDILEKVLPNGLTIAVKENHSSPVVSLRAYVKTGSMYEGEYLGAGISHLLEHLVHGGTTPTRTEEESRELLMSIGNSSNAYTSKDVTSYYINTVKQYFDIANDLLADWLQNCSITKEEFERERGVVQREIEKGEQEPVRQLYELSSETMFKVHPVRVPTIGYKELLQRLTRDEVYAYYRKMYAPNNITVVAVGDFDAQEVVQKITETYGNFAMRQCIMPAVPQEPPQLGKRHAEKEMDVEQCYMIMGFRTIPLSDPDLYPLDIASYVLSRGDSSRLVEIVKDQKQLVHSIVSWSHTPQYDAGQFAVRCTLDEDKLDAAQEAILEELMKLKDKLVDEEELERAKRQKVADDVFSRQTIEDEASDIGTNLVSAYDPNFSKTYVRNIQKVTAEEVREAAKKYFLKDYLCVAVVRPRREPAAAAREMVKAPPGMVQKFEMANGIRVLTKHNPTAPIVVMQAFFLGGVRFETKSDNGIFNLMSSLMIKGTKTRTADEIAAAFDGMGGSIASSSGNNTFYCTASVLREDFPRAFEIFADVVMNPVFAEDELKKRQTLMVAAIRRRNDNWYSAAHYFFIKNFFKVSPYGMLPGGEEESVNALTRKEVVELHRRYCVANNMILAMFGDIESEKALEEAKRYFSPMRRSDGLAMPSVPAEPFLQEDRKAERDYPGVQAVVYLGFPGMSLKNIEDRFPMMVLDAALSGIKYPGGWLHDELRGKQLVYVVHAYNWMGLEPGYIGMYAACPPARVDEVVEIILRCVERMKRGELPDEELDRAKRVCIADEELSKQENSAQAMEASLDELYGLGCDFSDHFAERIEKVRKDDVVRVANKYLGHYVLTILKPEQEKK